jgi:hypothetical protein
MLTAMLIKLRIKSRVDECRAYIGPVRVTNIEVQDASREYIEPQQPWRRLQLFFAKSQLREGNLKAHLR